jgi:hypothetical protein
MLKRQQDPPEVERAVGVARDFSQRHKLVDPAWRTSELARKLPQAETCGDGRRFAFHVLTLSSPVTTPSVSTPRTSKS